jgi:catechol 2,3-dioxygenase-like lactoylglutathione lyase family enzyme
MANQEVLNNARVKNVAMKLEVIVIPVSDVERAEQFYRRLGWRQDVTPPGSGVFQFTRTARRVRFDSVRTSRPPHPVQPRERI